MKNTWFIDADSIEDAKKIYWELSKKYHPDLGGDEETMKAVNDEYDFFLGHFIGSRVHEFGTDKAGRGNKTKIPKRSFIVMPIETKQSDIQTDVERKAERHLGNGDVKSIFKDIGVSCEAQIQKAFDTSGFGTWAPNADSTIERKGSDSPLIDDGTLRKSITSEVGE